MLVLILENIICLDSGGALLVISLNHCQKDWNNQRNKLPHQVN